MLCEYKYYILIVWKLNNVFDVGKVLEWYDFLNVICDWMICIIYEWWKLYEIDIIHLG